MSGREAIAVSTKSCGLFCGVGIVTIVGGLTVAMPCAAQQLTNETLSLSVSAKDGSYQLAVRGGQPIFTSQVAAQVDHQLLRSSEYPRHQVSESTFSDELGPGHAITVTFSGLDGKPELIYVGQVYDQHPYAAVQVQVRNTTNRELTVQAIRSVDAIGDALVNLGGSASADRILSDSFSEDWPELHVYDLGKAPGGMHRGAGSQLIYNRDSKQSLFLGALSCDDQLFDLLLAHDLRFPSSPACHPPADRPGPARRAPGHRTRRRRRCRWSGSAGRG